MGVAKLTFHGRRRLTLQICGVLPIYSRGARALQMIAGCSAPRRPTRHTVAVAVKSSGSTGGAVGHRVYPNWLLCGQISAGWQPLGLPPTPRPPLCLRWLSPCATAMPFCAYCATSQVQPGHRWPPVTSGKAASGDGRCVFAACSNSGEQQPGQRYILKFVCCTS